MDENRIIDNLTAKQNALAAAKEKLDHFTVSGSW